MNNKEIFKKVGTIISELNDQYSYLSENPGSLNEFELELLRANVKFLGEHIEILQRLNHSVKEAASPAPYPESGPDVVAEAETPPAPEQPVPPAPEEEKQEFSEMFKLETTPEQQPAKEVEEEEEAPAPELPETTVPEPAAEEPVVRPVFIPERTVVIETPQVPADAVPTVRDQIAAALGQTPTLAGSLGKQPVTDLKSAISLNDKLLFVKELFNGYSLSYSEAINRVNLSADLASAKAFLQQNYAMKNNWSERQAIVDKLYALIERRFSR